MAHKNVPVFFMHQASLSATIVRNILSKLRSYPDIGTFADNVYFRHGRYYVCAHCSFKRCLMLYVRRDHRDFVESWQIRPGEYPLLPSDAFNL